VYYHKIVLVNGELCYLSGCKLNPKNLKQEFLIIVSFNKPENAQHDYQKRWQIEMCFKAMKSSGFDIEKTHLQDIQRIEKLILLVMIAFVWCYKIGIYLHQINPIKIKKHGRRAKSIFKYGLTFLANVLLNSENQYDTDIFRFCHVLRFIREKKDGKMLSVNKIYDLEIIKIENGGFIFSRIFLSYLKQETFSKISN